MGSRADVKTLQNRKFYPCHESNSDPSAVKFAVHRYTNWAFLAPDREYFCEDILKNSRKSKYRLLSLVLRGPLKSQGPRKILIFTILKETLSGVKLTTHFQLVPRSRKCGSIHPLSHTPSWPSA
jgi:hypothetical protein